MMDPITNSKYSDDFRKFVLQNDKIPPINPNAKPVKPFKLGLDPKTKKSNKEREKKSDKEQ
jgi:hypothetical protein